VGARRRGRSSALVASLLFVALAHALLSMPPAPVGLTGEALAALARSGVSNPVTAALLNYRAYDTLLEVAVLMISIVAVWSVRPATLRRPDAARERPLLASLGRVVVPALVLASGYLLWRGAFAPGGAFQGGALLGGACVLLLAAGSFVPSRQGIGAVRLSLVMGTSVFVAVAAGVMLLEGNLLQYPEASAKHWILAIESAAMLSIGLTLGAMYLAGRPSGRTDDAPRAGGRP
jgi:multisubunit Na+/H+ antiporter MnhB subunit